MPSNEYIAIEGDKCYRITPMPQYGEGMCKQELVMTKEIFEACYKRWILGEVDDE